MTRRGFEEVHGFFDELNLPVGDSFWLFDPSGGDMGLFTHDLTHPGPQHAWLLEQISSGVIDVIHSAGSYGARFNRGYRPDRSKIEKALVYLDKHAVVPKIWTNHGDALNTQNIGGFDPALHHEGDLLGSDSYCLDLLRDYGVEYFWLDRLIWRSSKLPYRVTSLEQCRDGNEIETFTRYLSPKVEWSPNGENFSQQIQIEEIKDLVLNRQDSVFYTHWGCHHQGRTAKTPIGDTLTVDSRTALSSLARQLETLDMQVVRLEKLLEENRKRSNSQEIQRIGEIVVRPEKDKPDSFYYNQYAKHGLEYFRKRLEGMEISGLRALDAGCGVGQWSYALLDKFDEVYGIEMNSDALTYLDEIVDGVRLPNTPQFIDGSIESLPYDDKFFDFVLCYGVLFCANIRRSLEEFSRVLKPGGVAYICVNGDGWYEFLIDERFRDKPEDFVVPLAEPIWNALVARTGGEEKFIDLVLKNCPSPMDPLFWDDHHEVRLTLENVMSCASDRWAMLVRDYSDRTIKLLGHLTYKNLCIQEPAMTTKRALSFLDVIRSISRYPLSQSTPSPVYFPVEGIGSRNRAMMPDEFAEFAKQIGMRLVESAGDAGLCKAKNVNPIYDSKFNGHDSVWECFCRKGQ